MTIKSVFLSMVVAAGIAAAAAAQSAMPETDATPSPVFPSPRSTPTPGPEVIPTYPEHNPAAVDAFRGIALGMSVEKVKELLKADPYFNYRGDPDVSFLPGSHDVLIEVSGNLFIRRAYFQFVDKRLFSLILDLDVRAVDYYSLFTTLMQKYGPYVSFSPETVVWEIGGVRLALEKPLTVKYVELGTFTRRKEEGRAEQTMEKTSLEEFLKSF